MRSGNVGVELTAEGRRRNYSQRARTPTATGTPGDVGVMGTESTGVEGH